MTERRVTFNAAFRAANRTEARYRVLCGSAGSGKSYNVAQDYIAKLSDKRYAGANLLVVRKTESSNRGSTFSELTGAVGRLFGADAPRFWKITEEPMMLKSTVTGAEIRFCGLKDAAQREKVKSISFPVGKLTWIWIEEATELTKDDFEILDDRLRGTLGNVNPALYYQITLTFNPVSADHWLKARFFDAPASPDVFRHRSVFGKNPFIDDGFKRRMERRASSDPDGYRVYGLGEWGSPTDGRILTNWRAEKLSAERDDYDACWLAQDFGYNHYDCILRFGTRDGVLYVLSELYVREKDTAEIIELAERAGIEHDLLMYCDSAEPDRIRMWQKAGFRARAVKKGAGSVRSQIDFLKQKTIVVNEACTNVIRELENWRWIKDETSGNYTDVPVPENDDAMAALRYGTEFLMAGGRRHLSKSALGL